MAKELNIYVSPEDFEILQENNLVAKHEEETGNGRNSCAGLSRVVTWFTQCNCAIMTAWRYGQSRAVKDANNKALVKSLHEYGYGVCKVQGCYTQTAESPTEKENSFLVVNLKGDNKTFFKRIFDLSTLYNQDSFLYKEAGENRIAYLFKTNNTPDDTFKGRKSKPVGTLHIGSKQAQNYSRVKNKKISFETN